MGICSRRSSKSNNQPSRTGPSLDLLPTRQQLAEILPICGLWYAAKLLTLYSFSLIPMSMTYTLKAISPPVSCLLTYIFKGRVFSWGIYLSLVPISGGVILATVGAFEFSKVGLMLGGASTLMGVMYSMGMKELLSGSYSNDSHKKLRANKGCRTIFICIPHSNDMTLPTRAPTSTENLNNLQTSANESTTTDSHGAGNNFLNEFISSTRLHFHVSFFGGNIALVLHFVKTWRALQAADINDPSHTMRHLVSLGGTVEHVFLVLILNGVLNFGSSFFSYLTLSLSANLTWQVFNTLKRLSVIVVSIICFGTKLKQMTIVGMLTAVFGVGSYNVIKSQSRRKPDVRGEDDSLSSIIKIV